ncbi:MAG: hypothetical protein ACK5JH_07265 [Anaerocolumna sp.]
MMSASRSGYNLIEQEQEQEIGIRIRTRIRGCGCFVTIQLHPLDINLICILY